MHSSCDVLQQVPKGLLDWPSADNRPLQGLTVKTQVSQESE